MIEIEKLVGDLTKKETMKVSESLGKSIKEDIEQNNVYVIVNPKYAVLCHVKGNSKNFDCYVFCDENGQLYTCGMINAGENAVAYMREMETESEDYALSFSFQISKKTGNKYIKCELL